MRDTNTPGGLAKNPDSTQAYAMRVLGDSMRPRYRDGEFAIITPGRKPQPGNDVVVVCKDGRTILKKWAGTRDGEMQFHSVNSDDTPLTLPMEDVLRVLTVTGLLARDTVFPSAQKEVSRA